MDITDSLWTIKTIWPSSQFFGLKSKTVEEVAYQLMEIFCMFSAPFIPQSNNGREFEYKTILGWYVVRNEVRAWKAEIFSKSRISWKIQPRCSRRGGCLDVRQYENLVWRTTVYPKQEKPSSAFRHQDKPLSGYVWNGAEDRTWGFSTHWRHVLFNANWRTGTAL